MRTHIWEIVIVAMLGILSGCETAARTGALSGGGFGALVGGAVGGNAAGALIGTGVGAGVGYVIGNEVDKKDAQSRTADRPDEVKPLAGTAWQVVSMNPPPETPLRSTVLTFKYDGTVLTTRTDAAGHVETISERYRIVGDILIINQTDYVINARYSIHNDQLIIDDQRFHAVLQRIAV